MKKLFLLLIVAVSVIAAAVYAESTQTRNTGEGLKLGTTVTQKVGFFGATPVVRQTLTNTAPVIKQLIGSDGSTNAVACLTSNQLAQIITALSNLGLTSTDGK